MCSKDLFQESLIKNHQKRAKTYLDVEAYDDADEDMWEDIETDVSDGEGEESDGDD